MRSFGHRWTVVIVMFAIASTMGCRGSNPFGRFVQVSKATDAGLPEIDAPPQRLATTKPRVEMEAVARSTRESTTRHLADDSPHVTRTASSKSPKSREPADARDPRGKVAMNATQQNSRSRTERSRALAQARSKQPVSDQPRTTRDRQSSSKQSPTSRQISDAKTTSQRPVTDHFAQTNETKQETAAKRRTKSSESNSERSSDAIAENKSEQTELMTKFSDYPPEVQKEALRRLVAATSRSAERTGQPNSLETQLAGIAELPKLPKLRNSKPEVPPTRLATDLLAGETKSGASKTAALTLPTGASDSITDLLTTELESVVQTASEAMAASTEVQPASASRDANENESELVARAAAEETTLQLADKKKPEESKETVQEAPEEESIAAQENATMLGTDSELYGVLLKRLATAAPGESEAQRSSRLIKLRHLMVLAGNPDDAVAKIDGMSKSEQEYLRHQLLGLWTMIDPDGHPIASRRFSTAVPQIREAAKFAAAATDTLEVRSLAFCTEIESYGQIKTFPGNRFNPGQQVIMYCEIENFTAKKSDEGYETNLQGSYDIYNSEDEKVISQLLPADQQVSANYLRDYFIAYQMHLPQQLEGGTYRMQLTMEDVNGKKYGQTSIPFEIAK